MVFIRTQKKFLPCNPIRLGQIFIKPSASVRILGVNTDSHLSFDIHVSCCVFSCFSALRQIRFIRRSLNRPILISVITSLVLSRLDYCVSVLHGVSKLQLQRLQSVLNASARLVFSSSRFSPVAWYLRVLRFLPVHARIKHRLCVLTHYCLQGNAPNYLSSELCKVSDLSTRPNLRSSSSSRVLQPRSRHSTHGGRAFPIAAAKTWNNLPLSLTSIVSTSAFKKELKKYYLERSFK